MRKDRESLPQGLPKQANADSSSTCLTKGSNGSYWILWCCCTVLTFVLAAGSSLAAQSVTLSPPSLGFGNQAEGTPSVAKNTILKNGQSTAITIRSIATSLPEYTQTNNCPVSPATLGAKKSCTIAVTFTPAALGSLPASLTINDNGSDSPQVVPLSGTGIMDVAATPASVGFGNQGIGEQSAAHTVTVKNNEHQAVTLYSISTSLADYSTTTTCPLSPNTLGAQATCSISVFFTPAVAGSRKATLSVTDNAENNPTVSLAGNGVVPATVGPNSLKYASQALGTTSAPKLVILKNNQSAALTISSITSTVADFAFTSNCPLVPNTLAGGATCTAAVTFSPQSTGPRTGGLNFTDNTNNSPQTVSLSGTGLPAVLVSIAVSPQAAFIALGTTQQFMATGTYTDGSTQNLTNSVAWATSVPAVARMSGTGLATSLSQGTTTITATSGTISGSGSLTVTPPALISLAITPASVSIPAGTNQQFTATGTYTDGSTQNLTNSSAWASSSAAATINGTGLATGVLVGNSTISATSGSIVGTASLTVGPAALVSIAVTPANPSILQGATQQFTATGTYTDGSTQNLTSTSSWTSSNPSIASVNTSGLATALAGGSTTVAAASGTISGNTTLTVTAQPVLSRVPERMCLVEVETSLLAVCTLPSAIPIGDGVVVFITSTTRQTLAASNLQDSQGNTYNLLSGPVSGGYGSVYMAYSQLTAALNAGNAISLTVPAADSWGLSIYDLGPVQSNQADVGVAFQNANVGLPGVNNPATGVPGWWTGQTPATTGSNDICMAALGVGAGGSDDGAPAPITSYSLDHNFTPVAVSQFYAQSDPNFVTGGSLLTIYAEVLAGTSVQSDIVGPNPNTAPAVLYCFKEGPGRVTQTPRFTGNDCTGPATCTINNVAAGDMLIISGHTFSALPPTPILVTDTQNETVTFDQVNGVTGLGTWHIAPVVNAGTHTITVNDAEDGTLNIDVAEVSGQASGNPVESVAQVSLSSAFLGVATLNTSVANDLLYGWGRASNGTDEGEGFNAIRVTPTAEYAIAPGTGAQPVNILPRPPLPATTVGDQAMAIRPAGSNPPPVISPGFTGNYSYCQLATSCTINNVSAGNILVLTFFWWGQASDAPVAVDSLGETVVLDRGNDTDGNVDLALWHIAGVVNAGSHTLSVNNVNGGPSTLMISEYTAQSTTNPVDAVVGATGFGATATASLVTSQGADLIYVACVSPAGTTADDNYALLAPGPVVDFRMAASAPGTETATCPLIGSANTWVIQELALKH